jgi:transglutaminase-like putative cysteine protease
MDTLSIRHRTIYRYRRPVGFGEHRLMFRPRDSHDLRHVSSTLAISPAAAVRWRYDVFGNSIAIATFSEAAEELVFESDIVVEHYGFEGAYPPLEDYAEKLPFSYAFEELPDLRRSIERHHSDPQHKLDAWVRRFLADGAGTKTWDVLLAINTAITREFVYVERAEEGVQTPIETLERASGTCRDFALLMMEAVRTLGMAAHFVTGYLYDPGQAGRPDGLRGAGATHAWSLVYLPGAGWVEFDPTNGLVGGANLIRVGIARDPSQAIPVQGTYFGATEDFIDMTVEVGVERVRESASVARR